LSKLLSNLFRITSIVIFAQLLLGGLLTFNFITPVIHIIVGFIVFALAIATMIVALRSKNAQERVLRMMSTGLVALIVVQIILGFETLNSGSQVIAWIHFAVALVIYGMSAAGSVMSSFLGRAVGFGNQASVSEIQKQSQE
jgi:heme A synthase